VKRDRLNPARGPGGDLEHGATACMRRNWLRWLQPIISSEASSVTDQQALGAVITMRELRHVRASS
jgi:hypothetical protein